MKTTDIAPDALARLIYNSRLLERGPMGDKVRLTGDGRIIKFFYLKRRFSSALFNPYARRFCHNAVRLQNLGVDTVDCLECYYDPARKRYLVVYALVSGKPLRQQLHDADDPVPLLECMAGFLADLHGKGVYFRSIHFGNVLMREDRAPALIDITDMTIRRKSLGPWRRARNFRHLSHDASDRQALLAFGLHRFLTCYEKAAALAPETRRRFRFFIRHTAPGFLSPDCK